MSTIKINNDIVIGKAKEIMKFIQLERHEAEFEAIKNIEEDFDALNKDWIYNRDFKSWFKYFGPFGVLGFVGYPFSVISRYSCVANKLQNATIYEKAEYLDKVYDYRLSTYIHTLENSSYENHHEKCKKLKCMAEKNEHGHMDINEKEAEDLWIC